MQITKLNKPTFIMMCGIPGSGKSYEAEKLAQKYNAEIFSSDAYRKKLFGDESIQDNPTLVFSTLYNDMIAKLLDGGNVIFDATNLSVRTRGICLDRIKDIDCTRIACVVSKSLEVALNQNNSRERKVPEEVIRRMYGQFQLPTKDEGFDDVMLIEN